MQKLDDYIKASPDVYQINRNMRLRKIHEFSFDDAIPPMNCFVMWEPPKKGFTYTVAVDPSWGIGEDRSVIHVLRNGTMHTRDTQVAEFVTDDVNMHDLAPFCYMVGNLYKDEDEGTEALMSVECNISDDIVHDLRTKYNYGNLFIWKYYDNITRMASNKLGWWTTSRTRPKLINKAMQYIKHGWWDIASPWLIAELETIEKLEEKAQIKAAGGFHDDIFMAGAIALWSAHDMEFSEFAEDGELAATRERNKNIKKESEVFKLPPMSERKDFQNTATSWRQMEEWDTD
jgi:hypothetical protein